MNISSGANVGSYFNFQFWEASPSFPDKSGSPVLKFQKLQKKSNQLPKTGFITFVGRFKGVKSIPLLHLPLVRFHQNLRSHTTTFEL